MDKLRRSLHTFLEIEVFAVESLVVAVSAGLGTYEQQLRLLLLAHVFVTCQSSNVQPRDVLYTQYIDMSSTVQHSVITCSHKRKLHPPLKGSPRTQDWSEPSVRTEPSMCRCGKCKQEGKKEKGMLDHAVNAIFQHRTTCLSAKEGSFCRIIGGGSTKTPDLAKFVPKSSVWKLTDKTYQRYR